MIANASEPTLQTESPTTLCNLPPLILHPFSDRTGTNKLIENSRAVRNMPGLPSMGQSLHSDLQGILVESRYSELRMLYYVGKDINRWVEQCLDCVRRQAAGSATEIRPQSFLTLLIQNTPDHIREKLQAWGVSDYRALFSRGIGLNLIFADAPERPLLSDEFVRNYYQYSNQLFCCYQAEAYPRLAPALYHFELYSSGEYSRMLERSWETG